MSFHCFMLFLLKKGSVSMVMSLIGVDPILVKCIPF